MKRMKKLVALLSMLVCVALQSFSQSVKFNNFWIEHGKVINNRNGMIFHVNMDVYNAVGKPLHIAFFVDHPQNVGWMDINGQCRGSNGVVAVQTDLTASWPTTHWDDCWIFIPYDEVHMTPEKRTYYARAWLFQSNTEDFNRVIGKSDFVAFDGWGGSNNLNNNNNVNRQNNSGYTPQPYTPTQHANRCGPCGGTGKCSICYGSGISPNHAAGIRAKCGGCGGTGICPTCRGTGISGYSYY